MTYPWFEFSAVFRSLGLDVFDVELTVSDDYLYVLNDVERSGASGKTCWYVPLSGREGRAFGVNCDNVGLKIIKYPVYNDIRDEYSRLLQEVTIQKILCARGLAPDLIKLFLIRNVRENSISWLDQRIEYPAGSVFFAMIVGNVMARKALSGVGLSEDGVLFGPKIDELQDCCRQLRIEPYDLTLENVYLSGGKLGVLDVHKWRRTYGMRYVRVPKYLQIELNNTCNARCTMCAIPHMTRRRGCMSDRLFEKIVKEAGALGVEYITPFLHGEPFMRNDFVEKLYLINEWAPSARITVFTNASLLDEEKLVALASVRNVAQIVFSFPGGNKVAYEQTTGLDFETTVHNIKRAFQLLNGFNLRISMPKCIQNKDSEDDFARLWEGYPHSAYDTYNYLGDAKGTLSKDCYEQCDRAFRTMTVMCDGKVCLCCMDHEGRFIMGDLSKSSIIDVWHGPQFTRLRREHGCCRLACEPCNRCTQDLKTEEYNDAYHTTSV